MERERLKSRLGFILLSAGCAIGIGNVWKFPYIVGENGGGIFVLIYLFFLLIMGVPVMTMEFAMGRAAQKSPVKMYQQLEKKGQQWHHHGKLCLVGNYLLMMFYTTVSGWLLYYCLTTAIGGFSGLDKDGISDAFSQLTADPVTMIIYMAIVVVVGFVVCGFGVQKGLEKVTKVMMVALLVIMVGLAVASIFMDGGVKGLEFYLMPDINKINTPEKFFSVVVAAMNQSFFSLSVGIGSMAIFGSYIGKGRSLMGESVNIALLDTFVAFTSGLIIFPACFAHGVEPDNGPNLIFVTLPNVFNSINELANPWGTVLGTLFFVFLSFAALSTIFAVFENILSCTMELFGWGRKKACIINGIAMFLLSLPCVLGFNLLSGFQPFGENSGVMDFEDFIVSNIILPLGALVIVLFCTIRYGWGWDKFVEEANQGRGLKVKKWMRPYMTFVLPAIVLVLFVVGILSKFGIILN